MKILSSESIIQVVIRALNYVDVRLAGHCERVAYIMYQIEKYSGVTDERELLRACILGIVHDIGAYKTNVIDQMLAFESEDVWEHSVYGYLFLKHFSPLTEISSAVLYHHLPFDDFCKFPNIGVSAKHASLINLSDRIDVLYGQMGESFTLDYIVKNANRLFDKSQVELFLKANAELHIIENLNNSSFKGVLSDVVAKSFLSDSIINKFLEMIVFAIDFRSEFTVLHTITTVGIVQGIAELLNYSDQQKEKLYFGALMHDLGKIATPVTILEKTDKLTYDEMEIMKQHVCYTAKILGDDVSEDVKRIACRHHEKLDGSGYPDKLIGEQLTQEERIIAVSDIVSALVSKRSYKEKFDEETCRSILLREKHSGKICPLITDLVLDNFSVLIEFSANYNKNIIKTYTDIKSEYNELLPKTANTLKV